MKKCLAFVLFLLFVVETAPTQTFARDNNIPDPQEHWRGSQPNILWIMLEDWSTDLSCYGTPLVQTPHIDRLAEEGIRYESAFSTAPVCSTSRSAMMTGFHQNYIHAHQHRTADKKPLPYGIRPIPHLLKEAGYFTGTMKGAKTDCNFSTKQPLFDGHSWRDRKDGQPFFIQATFAGTHRGFVRDPIRPIDENDVVLPPYYPDVPLARRDWANGLETVQVVDRQVGELLDQLEADGLKESTLVFLIGDHGRCHIRGKQFLYDPGVHIPLIVRYPNHILPNSVSSDLVSTLDICQTIVTLAGASPQHPLHGTYLFGKELPRRQYVHFNRDKMDDTHDAMRAVRSKRYKLIQNLMPERAYCQLNEYKERSYPMLALMNVLAMQGQLTDAQAHFMNAQKPPLELYDLEKDPHEINNVADDADYEEIKADLLHEIDQWRTTMNDDGVTEVFRSGGWPSTYPTKSLEDWKSLLDEWNQTLLIEGKASRPKPKRKKNIKKVSLRTATGTFDLTSK